MKGVKERPILFKGEMVRRIDDGSKTQTRRPVNLPELRRSTTSGHDWQWRGQAPIRSIAQQRRSPQCWQDVRDAYLLGLCPYGVPGDRLWVKETFYCDDYRYPTIPEAERDDGAWRESMLYFRADVPSGRFSDAGYWAEPGGKWRPSIHMPRWASRITLEVTSVRVERLHEITDEDAQAEGAPGPYTDLFTPRLRFERLWESINGIESWEANPWVWVVGFKRVEGRR